MYALQHSSTTTTTRVSRSRSSVTFSGTEHVGVTKAPDESEPLEPLQRDTAGDQVRHVDVPHLEAGLVERGHHLTVSVAALFSYHSQQRLVHCSAGGGVLYYLLNNV